MESPEAIPKLSNINYKSENITQYLSMVFAEHIKLSSRSQYGHASHEMLLYGKEYSRSSVKNEIFTVHLVC